MAAAIIQTIGWVFLPALLWPLIHLALGENTYVKGVSEAVIRVIDGGIFALGEATKWLLPLMVLSVAGSVFALSIFGVTTTKLLESGIYLQACVIMLGAAATLLAGQHVRVDIFHAQMSEPQKARVELIGYYILMMPVCILLLWNAQSFVGFAWAIREGSAEADGFRGVYLLKTLIPVFAVTMLVQGLSISIRAAMCLRGQERPERPHGVPPLFHTSPDETL